MIRQVVGGIAGLAVMGGVAVFGRVTSGDDETVRDGGEIVEAGGLGVFRMAAGDCVNFPDGDFEQVEAVEGIPCADPHDAEVYALVDGRRRVPG